MIFLFKNYFLVHDIIKNTIKIILKFYIKILSVFFFIFLFLFKFPTKTLLIKMKNRCLCMIGR